MRRDIVVGLLIAVALVASGCAGTGDEAEDLEGQQDTPEQPPTGEEPTGEEPDSGLEEDTEDTGDVGEDPIA